MSGEIPNEAGNSWRRSVARPRAWDVYVEEQIQQAQNAGQFDNLPGFGKPLEDFGEAQDENWWIRPKLRDEGISVLPPGLEILRDIEKTIEDLQRLTSEVSVRRAIAELNERIRKANFAAHSGPPSTAMPLNVDEVVERWRQRGQNS